MMTRDGALDKARMMQQDYPKISLWEVDEKDADVGIKKLI